MKGDGTSCGKVCGNCLRWREYKFFYPKRRKYHSGKVGFGYESRCKECKSKYAAHRAPSNRDRHRECLRRWRTNMSQEQREYYRACNRRYNRLRSLDKSYRRAAVERAMLWAKRNRERVRDNRGRMYWLSPDIWECRKLVREIDKEIANG